jgi:hypothetical protein
MVMNIGRRPTFEDQEPELRWAPPALQWLSQSMGIFAYGLFVAAEL